MKKIITSSILAISLTGTLYAGDTTYASLNGKKITRTDISMILPDPRLDFSKLPQKAQKEVLNKIIDKKLLSQNAIKNGIERDKEFKDALARVKEDLAFRLWEKKQLESIKVTQSEEKSFYNKNKSKFKKPATLKARHILVKTEKEAQAIIKELNKASKKEATFIKLAKTKSVGPSGQNGGDLGEFAESQMVPEFSRAAKSLSKGTYSKRPVKTQYGYHVIFLKDKKPAKSLSFNEVKNNIKRVLIAKKFDDKVKSLVGKLRKKANIVIK